MMEYTLYDKLGIARNDVLNKPFSVNLNLLLFSYLTLLKFYDELLDRTMSFIMSVFIPCTVAEDFRTAACIAKENLKDAEIQVRYINSIDPEDPYSYLFNGLIEFLKGGRSFQEEFRQSLMFLSPNEREELEKFLNISVDKEKLELYKIPDIVTEDMTEKVNIAIQNNPYYPPLKVSLAEILMKKEDFEAAKEKITAIISQYPFYPRATVLLANIYKRMGKSVETKSAINNLLATNPLTIYDNDLKDFIDEKEPAEAEELKNLFETNNPLMAFFKEMYKKIESRGSEKEVPSTEESKVLQSGNEAKENLEKLVEREESEEFKEKEPPEEAIPQEKPEEPSAKKEEKLLEENIPQEIIQEEKLEELLSVKKPPLIEESKPSMEEILLEKTSKSNLEEIKPEEPSLIEEEKPVQREEHEEENIELQVPTEKNHFDLGFEFLDKKEYEKAIKEFLQALKEETTNY